MPIEYPLDDDIANLPHVYFATPEGWDPGEENDDGDDTAWLDSLEDPDEMEDEDFYAMSHETTGSLWNQS
jgi:hypothetical protein